MRGQKGLVDRADVAGPVAANQPQVPRETPFPNPRNTPETNSRLCCCQNQTGTATMQFILDLIWDFGFCQNLVAQPPLREHES